MNTHLIGKDVNRIDGPAKVSGAAKYAVEFFAPDMLYAYVVSGAIAHGEIAPSTPRRATEVPGAIEVFTHKNRPHVAWFNKAYLDEDAPVDGKPLRPLYDEKIHHSGQPIALCVAETFEAARYMARLVEVSYKALTHQTDMTIAVYRKRTRSRSPTDPALNLHRRPAAIPLRLTRELSSSLGRITIPRRKFTIRWSSLRPRSFTTKTTR